MPHTQEKPFPVALKPALLSPQNKIIETSACKAFFKDRIIYIHTKEEAVIDLKEAALQFALWEKTKKRLVEDHTYGTIIDLREMKSLDQEARMHYAKSSDKQGVALALITGSPFSVFTANFFLNFNRGSQHVKLFTEEKKALSWVKAMLTLDDSIKSS